MLGIDLTTSREFEREIVQGCEGIKPGWVRVNFNYFLEEEVFRYIVEAITLVADHGHKLLPRYRFDAATGLWRHRDGAVEPPLRLSMLRYDAQGMLRYPHNVDRAPVSVLAEHIAEARALFESLPGEPEQATRESLGDDFEELLWFELPAESVASG